MKKRMTMLALIALAAPLCALTAPSKELTVSESVEIKAPVAKVWAATRDFDSLHEWHPGFSQDVLTKGSNNTVGAIRSLTVKDGPTFTEELLSFSEANRSYKYKILESPLPLRDYSAMFTVKPGKAGTSVVTWVGKFKRKDPSETPKPTENDAAAVDLITGVFKGGLANLKKQLEG